MPGKGGQASKTRAIEVTIHGGSEDAETWPEDTIRRQILMTPFTQPTLHVPQGMLLLPALGPQLASISFRWLCGRNRDSQHIN